MRASYLALFGCLLVLGCASPSPPPKPSPYHYGAVANIPNADRLRAQSHSAPVLTNHTSHGR